MTYCQLDSNLDTHPKLRRLRRLLDCGQAMARGYVTGLWTFTMRHAADGDLSSFEPIDIEEGIDSCEPTGALFRALVEAGFIDQTETGYQVHDWWERAESLKNSQRVKAWREKKREAGKCNVTLQNGNVRNVTDHYAPLQNVTVTADPTDPTDPNNGEEEESATNGASAPPVPHDPLCDLVFSAKGKTPTWQPEAKHVLRWRRDYPELNVESELRKALAHYRDHPAKRPTAGGYPGAVTRWLNRSLGYLERDQRRETQPQLSAAERRIAETEALLKARLQ